MTNALFIRKEPTTDQTTLALNPATKRLDVVAYADAECMKPAARWPWFYTNKPTKSHKTVVVNCARYSINWLN